MQQQQPGTQALRGFITYTNPPMGGGFTNTNPPPYYTEGYTQGPTYTSYSGTQNQPMMQNPTPTGWGGPNIFAPPMQQTQSEPSRRNDKAMDTDDPMPSQWLQA